MESTVSNCKEGENHKTYYYSVRAINIDDNGKMYYGNWSPELVYLCEAPRNVWFYILAAAMLIIFTSFLFMIRK